MTTETTFSELNEHVDSPPSQRVAESAAKEVDEISLLDLLIVLAERKRVILWITAVFVILAIWSHCFAQELHRTVTLLPPQQNSSMNASLASQLGSTGGIALSQAGLGLKNPNDMFVGMLKSRTVEDATVKHFGLMQSTTRDISLLRARRSRIMRPWTATARMA